MTDVFERMLNGIPVGGDDEDWAPANDQYKKAESVRVEMNSRPDDQKHMLAMLRQLSVYDIDDSAYVCAPVHVEFGRHIRIGKNVFINMNCMLCDEGGIFFDDGSMVGPNVTFVTGNHLFDPEKRARYYCKPIHVKRNAWIGANSTIVPGVTIGENAVVGAGSVVTKDVPDNAVVVGNPARIIKTIFD